MCLNLCAEGQTVLISKALVLKPFSVSGGEVEKKFKKNPFRQGRTKVFIPDHPVPQ